MEKCLTTADVKPAKKIGGPNLGQIGKNEPKISFFCYLSSSAY